MPSGVNIIEIIPIMTNYFVLNFVFLAFAICMIYIIYQICKIFKIIMQGNVDLDEIDNRYFKIIYFLIATICLLIICIVVISIYHPDYTGEDKYKVEITDSASFNEVYNNYEILEQDGNIYLIKEKEFDVGNDNMEDFHYCPNGGSPIKFLSNIGLE